MVISQWQISNKLKADLLIKTGWLEQLFVTFLIHCFSLYNLSFPKNNPLQYGFFKIMPTFFIIWSPHICFLCINVWFHSISRDVKDYFSPYCRLLSMQLIVYIQLLVLLEFYQIKPRWFYQISFIDHMPDLA